jgi:uncharacterized protein YdeI (YjbR/CyaY-like superfamily)
MKIILPRIHTVNSLVCMTGRSASPVSLNPAVDAYIDNVKPFAVPILLHLRKLIHRACPRVEESIKWSRPFFSYKGSIVCNISAFTHHCTMGFWGEEIGNVLREADALHPGAMGSLGRITSINDLPQDKLLLAWLKQAVVFIKAGHNTSVAARKRVAKAPKADPQTPMDFLDLLSGNKQASDAYARFSPSCKREYLEWITGAKRAETRVARITTALSWIAEGKPRNWKYQS